MSDSLWKLKAKLYRSLRSKFPFNLVLKGENKRLEFILHSLEIAGKKVIDLGTGIGNVLQFFVRSGVLIGIDSTFSMLKLAKQLNTGVNLIQADALKLPIKRNSFELAICIYIYQSSHRNSRNRDLVYSQGCQTGQSGNRNRQEFGCAAN